VTYDQPGSYFDRTERPFQRGDSATAPLPTCQPCRSGNCTQHQGVYRQGGPHGQRPLRCRCACRAESGA
jgi:hypothetical protein